MDRKVERIDPEVREKIENANRSEVHRRTGISLSGVSRILSGNRTPSVTNLERVARALNMSMDDLHVALSRKRRRQNSAA